jgi:hypothetical protein
VVEEVDMAAGAEGMAVEVAVVAEATTRAAVEADKMAEAAECVVAGTIKIARTGLHRLAAKLRRAVRLPWARMASH